MPPAKRPRRTKTAAVKSKRPSPAKASPRAKAGLLTPAQAATELREYGWISMWVGQFEDEDALDMYINDEEFEHDIGYVIDRAMPPFHAFAEQPGTLFDGWGFSDALKKQLERALKALGIRANAAILESDYRWDPTRVKQRARPKVRFLGSFRKEPAR
jgi:hypothetical protein